MTPNTSQDRRELLIRETAANVDNPVIDLEARHHRRRGDPSATTPSSGDTARAGSGANPATTKAVVDTSVLLPGAFFGGAPRDVLAAWRAGRMEMVVSAEILREYVRIGERLSTRFPEADFAGVMDAVVANATWVAPPPLPAPACEDPDDDKFLACAVAGGARYLVSADKALLATSPYGDVAVVRARDFLEALAEGRPDGPARATGRPGTP